MSAIASGWPGAQRKPVGEDADEDMVQPDSARVLERRANQEGAMQPNTEYKRGGTIPLDCAWCKVEFPHIIDLLAHVDEEHLAAAVYPIAA
jgi:hypothetical protein